MEFKSVGMMIMIPYYSQYLRPLLMDVLHGKNNGKTPAGWRNDGDVLPMDPMIWKVSESGPPGFHPGIFNCDPDLGVKSLTHSENMRKS